MEDEQAAEWAKEKASFGKQISTEGMHAVNEQLANGKAKVYQMEAKLRDAERQTRQEKDSYAELMAEKRTKASQLEQIRQASAMSAMQEVAELEADLSAKGTELKEI